jgi:hypothetical protein
VVFTTFLDKSYKDLQEFLLYQDDIVLSSLLLRKNAQPDVTGAKIANNVPIFTHAGDMFRGGYWVGSLPLGQSMSFGWNHFEEGNSDH